jgi:hypothetical protein
MVDPRDILPELRTPNTRALAIAGRAAGSAILTAVRSRYDLPSYSDPIGKHEVDQGDERLVIAHFAVRVSDVITDDEIAGMRTDTQAGWKAAEAELFKMDTENRVRLSDIHGITEYTGQLVVPPADAGPSPDFLTVYRALQQ